MLFLAAAAAWSQALPDGAAECLERLEAPAPAGGTSAPPRVGDVCGRFGQAVDAGAWGAALAGGSAAQLTADSLRRLDALARHYRDASPGAARLAEPDLGRIVSSLEPFEPPPKLSLWDSLLAKLGEWLGLDRREGGWLPDWLRGLSIPRAWVRILVYVLGFAAVAGVLAVALNEMRHAGGRARRRRGRQPSAADGGAAAAGGAALTFEALRSAPPAEQPMLLFGLVVKRLKSRYAEAIRDSATHRELVTAAGRLGLESRGCFAVVAAAAEGVTFAATPASDLDAVLAAGQTVLRELESRPAS